MGSWEKDETVKVGGDFAATSAASGWTGSGRCRPDMILLSSPAEGGIMVNFGFSGVDLVSVPVPIPVAGGVAVSSGGS